MRQQGLARSAAWAHRGSRGIDRKRRCQLREFTSAHRRAVALVRRACYTGAISPWQDWAIFAGAGFAAKPDFMRIQARATHDGPRSSGLATCLDSERWSLMALERVDAYLETHRDALRGAAQGPDPDSQRQRPAGSRPGYAAGGDLRPRRPGGHGAEGRADPDQAASDRLCRVAGCPGQADAPGLRPLRRPASRAARAMALAAVRADHPRRQSLRPRRHRRQGPDVHAPEGGPGLAQGDRIAAGERQVPDRG